MHTSGYATATDLSSLQREARDRDLGAFVVTVQTHATELEGRIRRAGVRFRHGRRYGLSVQAQRLERSLMLAQGLGDTAEERGLKLLAGCLVEEALDRLEGAETPEHGNY